MGATPNRYHRTFPVNEQTVREMFEYATDIAFGDACDTVVQLMQELEGEVHENKEQRIPFRTL